MIKPNIKAIKVARLENGWDCETLAKNSEITATTITRIEKGASTTPASAKKIADALKKPVLELFSID